MNESAPRRQAGIATVIVVMLLVSGVLFLLSQSSSIIQQRSGDVSQDADSAAALMVAESGLMRVQSVVSRAQSLGIMTEAVCTGSTGSASSYTIGRGSLTFGTPVALPAGCVSNTCATCTVSATGTVGSAVRTLNARFSLGVSVGVAGRGTTVTMVLSNAFSAPTIALFELGWRRQGQGGNADGTSVTPQLSTNGSTSLTWNLESSNGNPSVGAVGTAVTIAAGSVSPVVSQTLNASRDYAEVGVVYPAKTNATVTRAATAATGVSSLTVASTATIDVGMSVTGTGIYPGTRVAHVTGTSVFLTMPTTAATGNTTFVYDYPQVLGSYWSTVNGNLAANTAFSSGTVAQMFNGFDATDATSCLLGPTVPNPTTASSGNTNQPCRSWCLDRTDASTKADPGKADTLVVGLSSRSTTVSEEVLTASFNTLANSGTYSWPAQSFAMTRTVHFPNTDGTTATASGKVYSEQWYAYNPPFTSSAATVPGTTAILGPTLYNPTIFGTAGVSGTIGTNSTTTASGVTTSTFTLSAAPAGLLCIDDQLSTNTAVTIKALPGGTTTAGSCSATTGSYKAVGPVTVGASGAAVIFRSNKFVVLSKAGNGALPSGSTVGATTTSSATATSSGGKTYYPLTAYISPPTTAPAVYLARNTSLTTSTVNSATAWTVFLPAGSTMPQLPPNPADATDTRLNTLLQVYKLNTQGSATPLPAGTKVVEVLPTSDANFPGFKISNPAGAAPSFVNAQLCGGVCALFSDPGNMNGSTSTKTQFTISRTDNGKQWSAGLLCLSGVHKGNIVPVRSSTLTDRQWWETVR